MANPHSSAELLQRLAEGDDEALRELYRQYGRLAYALALRVLGREDRAEDAVQEAFLRVWRYADRFDPVKGTFSTWFGRLVRNLCIDILRHREPLMNADPIEDVERWLDPAGGVDGPVLDRLIVMDAFLRLPPKQSQVLELAYFKGLAHREIAATLEIPEGTVKSRMRLGLEKMRQHLDGRRGQ